MKKSRLLMIMALVIMAGLIAGTPAAKADANLMENGSVQYAFVESADDMVAYVDNNGLYASVDLMEKKFSGYGNIYKIILDEPGELFIYPFAISANDFSFSLYSDFQLSSLLFSQKCVQGTHQEPYSIPLDAGTYYYRIGRNNGTGAVKTTVYLGFRALSGNKVSENAFNPKKYTEASYAIVRNEDELADFIHSDMAHSSQDIIETKWSGYTNVFQLTVDQPGRLIFVPLMRNGDARLMVFSNNDLTSLLLRAEHENVISSQMMASVNVDPGTYYYYSYRWNGTQELALSVYIGFIPDTLPAEIHSTYSVSENDPGATEIHPFTMDAPDEFNQKINGRLPDCTDTIQTKWTGEGDVYRFTLDESGMLYIWSSEEKYQYCYYNLYYSKNLDVPVIYREKTSKDGLPDTDHINSIYLDAGTYYFRVYRWNGTGTTTIKTYFGFYPISNVISVGLTELSADQKSVRVYFETNEDYNPDMMKAQIRVNNGKIGSFKMNNQDFWNERDLSNAIESHDFMATKNGYYTARIAGNGLQPYLLTFEVTGIAEDVPEQGQTTNPETAPETEVAETPAETETPNTMASGDLRKYIRTLEDQIEELGLELPEFSANLTQEDYMNQLEQVLLDNGFDP